MKHFQFLVLALVVGSCSSSQSLITRHYLDENGNSISNRTFHEKWGNNENDLARWDYQTDSGRVASLVRPVFDRLQASYPSLRANLEKITGRTIRDSTIFLLEYTYLNDFCTSTRNTWDKSEVRERKQFLEPIKEWIEKQYPQVLYLNFFEEGISLSSDPNSPEEYFYTDPGNFLRNSLFRNPVLCGSYALIKPNGQTLVRNGEHRADWMVQLLEEVVWEKIFPEMP